MKTRYEMLLREERASMLPALNMQQDQIYRSMGENRSNAAMSEMEIQCDLLTTTEDER